MGRRIVRVGSLLSLILLVGCAGSSSGPEPSPAPSLAPQASMIVLPRPRLKGPVSLEEALLRRRSLRAYARLPVTLEDTAQLLWAAQGVTDGAKGYRSAPSAGALYPLEVYLVAERVTGLGIGVYRYVPATHALAGVSAIAARSELHEAALSQAAVRAAPAVLVVAAVFGRTTGKYGERGRQYVYLEAGHAAQNVLLQAAALGLGAVVIGAFDEEEVQRAVGMRTDEWPIYVIPFGRKSEG